MGYSMDKLFERIINKLREIYPDIDDELNEGAEDCDIKNAEDKLGVQLPQDFIDFYKIHNGLDTDTGIFYGWAFLSLEDIVSEWENWKELVDSKTFDGIFSEPDDGIKNDWYNLRWIPIGTDGGGNCICIDFDPDKNGLQGQVIEMWHESAERILNTSSFKHFIEKYVKDLEEDNLVYDEDFGNIDFPWDE